MVFDTQLLCGGVLAGLVSVTASCHTISLGFACLTGLIGSMIYTFSQSVMERYEIDDPLHVSSIHGVCGIWSLLAFGLFDSTTGFMYSGSAK